MALDAAFLRQTELLRTCDDALLASIMARSREVELAAGEALFSENEVARAVWIVVEGRLAMVKVAGGDEVIVDRLGPGAHLGEISLLTMTPEPYRTRAEGAARLLEIPGGAFRELVRSCDDVLASVLRAVVERARRGEKLLRQHERLAKLGTLSAGIAHELNNPAAAASRASGLLRDQFAQLEPLARALAARTWSTSEVELLRRLEQATTDADHTTRELNTLARTEREEAVCDWLTARDVARSWELAPILVDRGVTVEQLDGLTRGCDGTAVVDALTWTEHMVTIRQLLEELGQGAARITELVRAVKAYSYTDTQSVRTADVHEGLENSLIILVHKLRKSKAVVERDYDRSLPPIQSHGTELSQVWTNLIDNAADAVAPNGGVVRVRTFRDGAGVGVEIADTGAGIPEEVAEKIFDPFFTTKGADRGTGLGLEIVRRIVEHHKGRIDVTSVPGNTRFTVRLPLAQSPL